MLDVVVLRVLWRQSSAYYATQPTNRVSAFGGSDISFRSIHICACRKEQTRATDRAAVASVWRSLPGVMVPCGCLCIVLSSYCQLFTRDNIPSGNENLASLARPYFPMVWFTRLRASVRVRCSSSFRFYHGPAIHTIMLRQIEWG